MTNLAPTRLIMRKPAQRMKIDQLQYLLLKAKYDVFYNKIDERLFFSKNETFGI